MEPAFIFRDDQRGPHKPDAGFLLFDQYLPAGIALAQGNLAVGPDDLDAGFDFVNCTHETTLIAGAHVNSCGTKLFYRVAAGRGFAGRLKSRHQGRAPAAFLFVCSGAM